MSNRIGQLEVFYINYEKDLFNTKSWAKRIFLYILLSLTVIGIIFVIIDIVKVVKTSIKGCNLKRIDSAEKLSKFINAEGNDWIISDDKNCHFYYKHPKLSQAKQLIDSENASKYFYEEYCNELVNYCCSHCDAKKIEITKKTITRGNTGAKFKKVEASLESGAVSECVFIINSPNGAAKKEPLPEYIWLEKKLMSAIDCIETGGSVVLKDVKDFAFGLNVDVLKILGANLDFSHTYEFTIKIEA